ncbi:MAG: hypothetical protein A2848_02085 [Candidatus Magasanikbacteria bacterium RIFCSPHIGHO2_01_FULL_50_8]|uniref:Uncharacterized protein n=1 Tax=Candidatus Magasanikbacteria bacterium RIFCSPHIGHO2_01_FULL_50_8 TaxID=1798674 RepID=A0A1F6LSA0_9BACT|nr:MAG: hypothetical protein A2848_02085 [Candidatus Magasanikbacteria bacterium RIFCSPHIGHO2_01_FULL_50_8]
MAHDGSAVTTTLPLVSRTRVIDVRTVHARVLWDNGWGGGRFPTFASYLATIPRVPTSPAGGMGTAKRRFSKLVLVDTMVPLTQVCRLLGVQYGGDDTLFKVHGDVRPQPSVYWMWVDAGDWTAGYPAFSVREALDQMEFALTVEECLALYACSPHLLQSGHGLHAAASRLGSFPAYCGCLMVGDDGVPTLGVAEYCVGASERVTPMRWG